MADSSGVASTIKHWLTWRPGGYLRDSGMLFGWLMLRTAAQTALFILVARSLGADGYGALIAVMAVASFLRCWQDSAAMPSWCVKPPVGSASRA